MRYPSLKGGIPLTTLCCDVAETVGAVLNTSPRPPALNGLTRIGYPVRELQPRQLAPGFVFITIKKDGYGYKQHYKPRKAERYTPERLFGIAATIGYCI